MLACMDASPEAERANDDCQRADGSGVMVLRDGDPASRDWIGLAVCRALKRLG